MSSVLVVKDEDNHEDKSLLNSFSLVYCDFFVLLSYASLYLQDVFIQFNFNANDMLVISSSMHLMLFSDSLLIFSSSRSSDFSHSHDLQTQKTLICWSRSQQMSKVESFCKTSNSQQFFTLWLTIFQLLIMKMKVLLNWWCHDFMNILYDLISSHYVY